MTKMTNTKMTKNDFIVQFTQFESNIQMNIANVKDSENSDR